jgi:DNA polymerase-3 subunit alpha
MELIVQARLDGGRLFANLYDFARRVDMKKVGKRPLEMLARAGAFDQLDSNRRRVFESLDALVAYSAAIQEQKHSAQVSLFGEAGDDLPEPHLAQVNDWMAVDRLMEEQKAIGFFLSGHPLDDYAPALRRKGIATLAEAQEKAERDGGAIVKVGVMISGFREMKSSKGTRYFRMNISDSSGQLSGIAMFPKAEEFGPARAVFEKTDKVVATLEARFHDGQFDPTIRGVAPVESLVAQAGVTGFRVFLESPGAIEMVATILEDAQAAARGTATKGPVQLCLMDPALPGEVEMDLGQEFVLTPQIKGALKSIDGVMSVEEL